MKDNIKIWRDLNGTPHVEAESATDLYWGMGYVHAFDRGMQMLLMRILGQGRVSELLDASENSLNIDKFFRKVNWSGNVDNQLKQLSRQNLDTMVAYCAGVNEVFAKKSPWEMKLLGYRPEEWKPEDMITLSRMIGYLTLVQSQDEIERLFVELVQGGVPEEYLQELFPGNLGGLDMELLKKVTLPERIMPAGSLWNLPIPRMMASNNWVISGKKTKSGHPIMANDPHLEVNRLPNVWCEMVLQQKDRYIAGGTMPGLPVVLVGRNNDIAWGVTYSFIDAIDSWVENCKEGKCYREEGDQWVQFTTRKEIINRKKKDPVEIVFYENDHGVLDGDPTVEGYYLATKWAAGTSGAVTFNSILKMWDAKTVEEGMDLFGKVETGWDIVFSDIKGNIGFQMTGLAPKRREGISGFIPLPGWKKENDWQGFYNHTEMPRIFNPEKGYFSTANNDLNEYGKASPINMPMGSYRADRIDQLIESRESISVEDVQKMHFDVYSLQAEYFMKILEPLLPDTPNAEILKQWDRKYDRDSKGANLFEEFYKELYLEVFGINGLGEATVTFLANETGAFIDFYDNFDRILLSEKSIWFGNRSRNEIYGKAVEKALAIKPKRWGDGRTFLMTHILFEGKLPKFLGFDKGPITGIGSRATIHQGQIYRSAGRDTTFFPSFRVITDMGSDELFSNIAGGPSDRRFSKWYCSELDNWVNGKYKKTSINQNQKKLQMK
ncbi:penicillin acylase family protein [bacterium]|nr:penicillin acylase family protein [bacterium]